MRDSKGIQSFVDIAQFVSDTVFPPSSDTLLVRGAKQPDLTLLLTANANAGGALLPFAHPLVRACIHEAKFHKNKKAALLLGTLLGDALLKIPKKPYILIPMPLSGARLRERGYNQTALIARSAMSAVPHITVREDIVARVKNTRPQTELRKEAREKNVKNAFRVKNPEAVADADIILLDDVVTTGATIHAAKAALLEHRPRSVMVVALAG